MRPLIARVSSAALAHNLQVARKHAGQAKLFCVIKANAYGHGLELAASALKSADGFAVLSIEEASKLRNLGVDKPILLLEGPFDSDEGQSIAELRLTPVIHRHDQLDWFKPVKQPVQAFLKFNSGMNRLGFELDEFDAVLGQAQNNAGIAGITLMTHFATADEDMGIDWQWQRFKRVTSNSGLPISAANSAALLRYPETSNDWARPGIMLYGSSPFADASAADLGLLPVMTLQSALIAVRTVQAGEGVGYGLSFMAEEVTSVGVVACGYADGYPRHAPTGTPVLVNGQRTRTLGRVSMDMLAVDLSGVRDAGIGSPVTLWGEGMPIDEVARAAGTISYELMCALAPRVSIEIK